MGGLSVIFGLFLVGTCCAAPSFLDIAKYANIADHDANPASPDVASSWQNNRHNQAPSNAPTAPLNNAVQNFAPNIPAVPHEPYFKNANNEFENSASGFQNPVEGVQNSAKAFQTPFKGFRNDVNHLQNAGQYHQNLGTTVQQTPNTNVEHYPASAQQIVPHHYAQQPVESYLHLRKNTVNGLQNAGQYQQNPEPAAQHFPATQTPNTGALNHPAPVQQIVRQQPLESYLQQGQNTANGYHNAGQYHQNLGSAVQHFPAAQIPNANAVYHPASAQHILPQQYAQQPAESSLHQGQTAYARPVNEVPHSTQTVGSYFPQKHTAENAHPSVQQYLPLAVHPAQSYTPHPLAYQYPAVQKYIPPHHPNAFQTESSSHADVISSLLHGTPNQHWNHFVNSFNVPQNHVQAVNVGGTSKYPSNLGAKPPVLAPRLQGPVPSFLGPVQTPPWPAQVISQPLLLETTPQTASRAPQLAVGTSPPSKPVLITPAAHTKPKPVTTVIEAIAPLPETPVNPVSEEEAIATSPLKPNSETIAVATLQTPLPSAIPDNTAPATPSISPGPAVPLLSQGSPTNAAPPTAPEEPGPDAAPPTPEAPGPDSQPLIPEKPESEATPIAPEKPETDAPPVTPERAVPLSSANSEDPANPEKPGADAAPPAPEAPGPDSPPLILEKPESGAPPVAPQKSDTDVPPTAPEKPEADAAPVIPEIPEKPEPEKPSKKPETVAPSVALQKKPGSDAAPSAPDAPGPNSSDTDASPTALHKPLPDATPLAPEAPGPDSSPLTPQKPGPDAPSITPQNLDTDVSPTTLEKPESDAASAIPEKPEQDAAPTAPEKPETEAAPIALQKLESDAPPTALEEPGPDAALTAPEKPETDAAPISPEEPGPNEPTLTPGPAVPLSSSANSEDPANPETPSNLETAPTPEPSADAEPAAPTPPAGEPEELSANTAPETALVDDETPSTPTQETLAPVALKPETRKPAPLTVQNLQEALRNPMILLGANPFYLE